MQLQLTNAGINALLRAISGDDLTLSSVKVGNGAAQSPGAATDLSNPLVTLSITECTVANSKATIAVTLNNSTVDAGFRMTEIGVFAQDQDDSSEEILYAYGTEPEATADYIAASGDNILEEDITIDVFVGNAENVSAIINESLVYATKAAFDAHVADKANPHEVTKAQVGLGNVPNVATNDQTVTFTAPASNAELTSGERLTLAFGKIARAISSLISHLANHNNPHQVTATQVNAAPISHNHSAADINTGVLGVARGGTGKGTWSAKRLLYASNSGTLEQIQAPTRNGCVLYGHIDQVPYWGLPNATDYGKYSGTGVGGSANRNTLHFEQVPTLVVIRSTSSASGGFSWAVLFPHADSGFSIQGASNAGAGSYRELIVSLVFVSGGWDLKWYCATNDPAHQMNYNGTNNYAYVAIY